MCPISVRIFYCLICTYLKLEYPKILEVTSEVIFIDVSAEILCIFRMSWEERRHIPLILKFDKILLTNPILLLMGNLLKFVIVFC